LTLAVCIATVGIISSVFPLSTVIMFGAAFLTLDVALYVFAHYGTKRRNRKFEQNTSLEKTTISDGELVVEGEHSQSVWRWSAFCQCRCSDQQVLLFVEPDGNRLVFPRRFFAAEGDWEAFVDLVRFKLPEDDASARELAKMGKEVLAGRVPPAAECGETENGEESPLLHQVEGVVSWGDWKHVQKRIDQPRFVRVMRFGCLPSLVAFLAVLFWLNPNMAQAWPLLIAVVVVTLFVIFPLFVLSPLALRRQWKRQEGPFGPFRVRIREDIAEFAASTSTTTIPWTAFSKLTLTDRVLLLYESPPNVVRFIPRAFFATDEEWERLVEFVRQKLSETPDDVPKS